ncbi:histone-lysine n-methyltransferase setmar-like protein [Elysia marginata]|uniref:Histone-lysine n-methyltransferase setmar-like protein n=1 Tax=Elysia marginata TaxID=1093978 RepID=A0AAV4EFF0_9GAST|nr:histone-lysine n-methyltransferase setmar-like protein [Elysia marginata]
MCAAISVGEKMASVRNYHLMKERSVIEFLTAEGCSAVVIHKIMKAVCGDACLTESKVRKWARFYRGEDPKETTVPDRKRPWRPVSATDTMHQQKVDEMIVANRRVKQKDIANALDISKERVHHIITVHLGYRKVSPRWVPIQLTEKMKAQRKTICTKLLERFTHDGERFLRSIITGDESWVHHYGPESKMQSMQYRHKNSPAPEEV